MMKFYKNKILFQISIWVQPTILAKLFLQMKAKLVFFNCCPQLLCNFVVSY